MHYVSALFDQVYGIDSYLNQDTWQECCKSLTRVLKALEDEPTIKLGAMSSDAIATIAQLAKTKPEAGNPEAGETAGKAQPAQDLTEDKVDEKMNSSRGKNETFSLISLITDLNYSHQFLLFH